MEGNDLQPKRAETRDKNWICKEASTIISPRYPLFLSDDRDDRYTCIRKA